MTEPRPSDEHPFFDAMREQMLDSMREQADETPHLARCRRRRPHVAPRIRARLATRPLSFAGAGFALGAALVALVIALGAGGSDPPPAYAISVGPNHTVTIYLYQLRAITKLNARLVALHTRIRVVPIVHGCVAPVHAEIGSYRAYTMRRKPGPIPGPAKTLEVDHITKVSRANQHTFYFTIENSTLPGRTLIIPVTKDGMIGHLAGIGDGVVAGPAPRCVGDDVIRASAPSAR